MKSQNQLVSWGTFTSAFGVLAFLPSLMGKELVILAWLGSMQQPVGISAMVVGGILFGLGKLQNLRNVPPVVSPTDPAIDPSVPIAQPNVLSSQAPSNQNQADRP
jgi:hypothetical protein